jgi:hypothetical protein
MTEKTSSLARPARRKLSKEARARMRESGRANIVAWNERQEKDANERRAAMETFETRLRSEIGPNMTATREALVKAAVVTYGALLLLNSEIALGRKKRVLDVTQRTSWLIGSLNRLLKNLGIYEKKPKPRTLSDVLANLPENNPNSPVKPL